jgi:5,10-methylenetetrahydromethanopterin reductase
MRFGVIYQSFDPPGAFLEYVRTVEDGGFDYLWVCDSSLHARDVIAYLTLAAVNTTRLKLGVSVFQPYTRHPAIAVNTILTLNEISRGRAMMAVGAGDRPQLELGYKPAPVHLVKEMIDVSRKLMRGESVTSETFHMTDARVRYPASNVPLYVACSGPRMLRMAGEAADGVIMMCGATPDGVKDALAQVGSSAVDVAWGAATVVDDDAQQAREHTRVMAAWFANHSTDWARRAGVSDVLLRSMQQQDPGRNLHEARAAAALAPDNVVDRLALAGPPAHIVERIEAVRSLGVDHFELFLIGPNKLRTLRRFSSEVMPAFR